MLAMPIEPDYNNMLWEALVVVVGLLQVACAYIFKRHVKDDDRMRQSFDAHVVTYNQTPNTLLLAEIRNLSSNLEDKHEANTNMIAAVNANVADLQKEVVKALQRLAAVEAKLPLVPRRT